jgi:hypothetical protein
MLKHAESAWQAIGQRIFEEIRDAPKIPALPPEHPARLRATFARALRECARGDPNTLIKYLMSGAPFPELSQEQREGIAHSLTHTDKPIGRQPDEEPRMALWFALLIYARWKKQLRTEGIPLPVGRVGGHSLILHKEKISPAPNNFRRLTI